VSKGLFMISVLHVTEVLASVVHTLVSLSVIVTHMTSNDPFGAVYWTVVGCLCLVAVTLVGAGCELLRWKIRQCIRRRELTETKRESRRLGG
jgi:hypothetical protein